MKLLGASDQWTLNIRPLLKRFDMVSGWSVALHDVEGQLLGTLGLFHPYRREPDDADWEALSGYADVAAIAMRVDRRQTPGGDQRASAAARDGVTEPAPASAGISSPASTLRAT